MLLELLMQDPTRRAKAAMTAPFFLLLGLTAVGVLAVHLAAVPWTLSDRAVTRSIASRCGPLVGDAYLIVVDGEQHWCSAGLGKCPRTPNIDIAYDPAQPSRCRALASLNRMGAQELGVARMGLGFSLVGIAVLTWVRSARRQAMRSQSWIERPPRMVRILTEALVWTAMAIWFAWC